MFWKKRLVPFALACVMAGAGCADDQTDTDNEQLEDQEDFAPPLQSADTLLEGAPKNDALPAVGKPDAVYPAQFTELLDLQSPVKSQGRRGVCSIFSTVGLMEHLYIKEGTYLNPDFSEQYVQWSAKNEVGAFRHTSGSNARSNLKAISQYGAVEEDVWPYEPNGWSTSDDEECTGDSMPTKCYTNGEPPAEAEDAQKWTLPRGRWLSTRTDDMKAFMSEKKQAVVVGLTFFYQAWNHGGSDLPVSKEYSKQGYVLYPNAADKEDSLEKRAGHSILLVGWDDTLEVQKLDENGEGMVDENGDPVTEKGFFIFKNSWGTGRFGKESPHGAGYGFISMEYVREYGSAYVSDVPELERPDEVCGDEIDNDRNGEIDCADSACVDHVSCEPESSVVTYASDQSQDIPDNDDDGITSTIEVADSGTIESMTVSIDITHTYSGDINAVLENPAGDTKILVESKWDSTDDIVKTFLVDDFDGTEAQGSWTMHIWDEYPYDTGTLNEWSMEITY